MTITICDMGAASLDGDGVLLVQCKGDAVDAGGTAAPDFGLAPMMCALGLTAMPYPATDEGSAEALVGDGIPGLDGVVIGARDTRTAKIVGNLQPGDTVLHSTGPQQAAQVQLKEKKRQAVFRTVDTRGKDMALVLDGKNDKVQLTAFGHMFEMNRDAIVLTHRGGATLVLDANLIALLSTVVLGGKTPFAPVHSGAGVGSTSIPTPGVFVGV